LGIHADGLVGFTAVGGLGGGEDDKKPERRPSRSGGCADRGQGFDSRGGTALQHRNLDGGEGYRRYRETGETEARKQGQPSHSKLDAHEAFILGLIEEVPDITLAEIRERLAAERGVEAATSTAWLFLDRRGITYKKDGACLRAAARGHSSPPHSLVR